ncbi:MAG: type II toxin-antitoxin system mRNA interferase toxin, RelE/StbE family [Bacilli bacterium]|nr:type II toxin-antitoxin system mRNA interferase toxin, RelE/StbE family [Bacilli bacterium]
MVFCLFKYEVKDKKCYGYELINNKKNKVCIKCHITPDWLLIYKYNNDELILLMVATGSHSELFNN